MAGLLEPDWRHVPIQRTQLGLQPGLSVGTGQLKEGHMQAAAAQNEQLGCLHGRAGVLTLMLLDCESLILQQRLVAGLLSADLCRVAVALSAHIFRIR